MTKKTKTASKYELPWVVCAEVRWYRILNVKFHTKIIFRIKIFQSNLTSHSWPSPDYKIQIFFVIKIWVLGKLIKFCEDKNVCYLSILNNEHINILIGDTDKICQIFILHSCPSEGLRHKIQKHPIQQSNKDEALKLDLQDFGRN